MEEESDSFPCAQIKIANYDDYGSTNANISKHTIGFFEQASILFRLTACKQMIRSCLSQDVMPGTLLQKNTWCLVNSSVLMAVCSDGFFSFVCLLRIIKPGPHLNSGNSPSFCKKTCSNHAFLWRCHRLKIFKKFSLQQSWAVINVCVLLTIWLSASVHNLVLIFLLLLFFFYTESYILKIISHEVSVPISPWTVKWCHVLFCSTD